MAGRNSLAKQCFAFAVRLQLSVSLPSLAEREHLYDPQPGHPWPVAIPSQSSALRLREQTGNCLTN